MLSIFALILLAAAAVIAAVQRPRDWWIPALIIAGIVVALVVTSGTMVTLH